MRIRFVLLAGLVWTATAGGRAQSDSTARTLDRIFSHRLFTQSHVGFIARSLTTGKTIYEKDADALLSTASCFKLVTTAAALDRWGPNYYFSTIFYTDSTPVHGVVKGNLYVRGFGDPYFVTEILYKTAHHLYAAGLREVTGDLVCDDSYLEDTPNAIVNDRAYAAPGGALGYNFNTVVIYVAPGAKPGDSAHVYIEPSLPIFRVVNSVRTTDSLSGLTVGHQNVSAVYGDGTITLFVGGSIPVTDPEMSLPKRIDDPTGYTGLAIADALQRFGITVKGRIVRGTAPPKAPVLYEANSYELSYIVSGINKWSNNFGAAQLLMVMGAQEFGPPGNDAKGIRALRLFLDKAGIDSTAIAMVDGSGLDVRNKMTPRALVTLLEYAYRNFEFGPEFVSSLSIAGVDGTEHKRFRKNNGPARRSRLKIGYLWGVSGLAGYMETRGRDRIAFALLTNDFPKDYYETIKQLEDQICTVLGNL